MVWLPLPPAEVYKRPVAIATGEGMPDTSNGIFGEDELKALLGAGPQLRILLMCLVDLNRLEEIEDIESQVEPFYRALIHD
ncbi:hypothetical protein NDU88_002048 [Pleurodeles waltl]|uniref:Uncharacterized protein n=1 Tax=Pleurodeles waltl TaxID=8319 RepID=A0AAV7NGW1_PLEWA|nr:hypothetical protein NDU88_002048 [Pleurodeles waltl]